MKKKFLGIYSTLDDIDYKNMNKGDIAIYALEDLTLTPYGENKTEEILNMIVKEIDEKGFMVIMKEIKILDSVWCSGKTMRCQFLITKI